MMVCFLSFLQSKQQTPSNKRTEMNKVVVIPISEKFTRKEKKEEEEFTRQTTGLVTAEQFKRKKKELVEEISDATDRARQQRFIELSFFFSFQTHTHTHTHTHKKKMRPNLSPMLLIFISHNTIGSEINQRSNNKRDGGENHPVKWKNPKQTNGMTGLKFLHIFFFHFKQTTKQTKH